jgi:tRNA threonylcarbamoyladenosine biosynthesis protein TsaB
MPPLLLAVDTSGRNGSLALARVSADQRGIDICEVVPLAGGTFSAQLVPQVAALLKKYGYSKSDLGAFAVVTGPGSFTGLRVGLAAVKALAEVLQKPIAAISLLEAIAWSSRSYVDGHVRVMAALDAGRGDVYAGNYELESCEVEPSEREAQGRLKIRKVSERLLSRKDFVAELSVAEATRKTVVTPDQALADYLRTEGSAWGMRIEQIEYPNSGVIARLGWEHLRRGEAVPAEELEANYIRRSDAEIFSKPKA